MSARRTLCFLLLFVLIGGIAACWIHSPSSAQAAPTPTPVVLPVRAYDPPAPPDLALPSIPRDLQTAVTGGYPRIVKLWGGYDPAVGLDFYARYDLLISNAFSSAQLAYLRSRNSALAALYSGTGTYDEDTGPLGSQWIDAAPGTPEYACFYRGTDGQVLRVGFWGHGMFNMGDAWCTDRIVDHLVSQYDTQAYDGVFFDRVTQVITPYILDGIDRDQDGVVDNRDAVNEAYWRGTERFLDQVRLRLGKQAMIVANDAPLFYDSRLHGREYESFIRDILDQGSDWSSFRYNYEQWTLSSRQPGQTMVMGNPPRWMREKYGIYPYRQMSQAAVDQAAAYYQRMRFGLATALLQDGLYSYEFGDTWHGNAWWYDEYDGGGLGKGYLGRPLGRAYSALGPLSTENVLENPGFESGEISPWAFSTSGAQAAVSIVSEAAPDESSYVAQIDISSSFGLDAVRLSQTGLNLVAGQDYTLSFWGRASSQLWNVHATVHAAGQPGVLLGLDKQQAMGTAWQRFQIPFRAVTSNSSAELSLAVGQYVGTVWLDQVQLQEGRLPDVYRRDFDWGTVLCNATDLPQMVPLEKTYYRIAGDQAPLVQIILDDAAISSADFERIGGWAGHLAGYSEWGDTYHHALTTTDPAGFVSSAIWRPNIPTEGWYTVYVWVAPHPECNAPVTYLVHHAAGMASVMLDPAVSEPAWISLGAYHFSGGRASAVELTNLSSAQWVVADAVKFESVARYNDGAAISQVTLAPMDGTVLLSRPYAMVLPYRMYLPIVVKPAADWVR